MQGVVVLARSRLYDDYMSAVLTALMQILGLAAAALLLRDVVDGAMKILFARRAREARARDHLGARLAVVSPPQTWAAP